MKKRKILCLLHLPPPLHGVSYLNSLIINSRLATKYNLTFVQISYSNDISKLGKFKFDKIFIFLKILKKFILKLITDRPHAIYFSITPCGNGFLRDSVFVLFSKFFRVQTIFHLHGIGIDRDSRSFFLTCLYRFVFQNSIVIVLSESILWDIEKYKSLFRKIYVVNNGIPIVDHNARPKENNLFTILSLSTITPAKGQLLLLKALKVLKNKDYEFKCNIVGQVSNISFYNKLNDFIISEKLESFVSIESQALGNRKYELLRNSDIFVFPTYWESFGLVVLEAFNFNLPVIASNVGSLSEIIDHNHNGFVFESGNHSELADYIEYFINNPNKLQEFGSNGFMKLNQNYSIDVFYNNLDKVFEDALSM